LLSSRASVSKARDPYSAAYRENAAYGVPVFAGDDNWQSQLSNPVGTFLFSGVSFMPAASAIVSISAAKSLLR
jgi:hypothetical protein